jgi:hypothetical protein
VENWGRGGGVNRLLSFSPDIKGIRTLVIFLSDIFKFICLTWVPLWKLHVIAQDTWVLGQTEKQKGTHQAVTVTVLLCSHQLCITFSYYLMKILCHLFYTTVVMIQFYLMVCYETNLSDAIHLYLQLKKEA